MVSALTTFVRAPHAGPFSLRPVDPRCALATPSDLLVKGADVLEQVLHESSDAELLVLATWNDLASGTGIHRNYDYWSRRTWLSSEHFMKKVRVSQSTERRRINVIG